MAYNSVSVTNYNASPPADDGTEVASNMVEWAKIKTKLTDPLKTALESVNTQLTTILADTASANVLAKSANYTIQSGDMTIAPLVIRCDISSGNVTITELALANMGGLVILSVHNDDGAGATYELKLEDSSNTEIWTGYVEGDHIILSYDGTVRNIIAEKATVEGEVFLTADEQISAGATNEKFFRSSISADTNIGGWYDATTNYRIDVPWDCVIEMDMHFMADSSTPQLMPVPYTGGAIIANYYNNVVNGTLSANTHVWTLRVSESDTIEMHAFNDEGSARNVMGDSGKKETWWKWRVVRRTR